MSALTAQEVYASNVKDLSPSERLRLAALILDDLANGDAILLERRDDWSEEDMRDLAAYSMNYANHLYPEEESVV